MYDVIVVGAGPAGSSAARQCAQNGLKTLLLDKSNFPREKLCGGAVSENALSQLDFELPSELMERDIYGARVHFGESVIEIRKEYRIAVLVSRYKFDHFLLIKAQEAGVKVIEGARVTAIKLASKYAEVVTDNTKYQCRIVIGCDGFNSKVAQYVRRRDRPIEYGNCLEVFIQAEDSKINQYIKDAIEIHLGGIRYGYGWVFPHKEYFSVGIGGNAYYLKEPKDTMKKFLKLTRFDIESNIQGHPIPAGGVHRKIIADRIILAGDAAGFVDSFIGEGIAYAIQSGHLAAITAASALTTGDCSTRNLKSYVHDCRKEFGISLWYSLNLSRLTYRYPQFFLKLMASRTEVLDKFFEIPARNETYKDFFFWLLPRLPFYLIKILFRGN
ncbi:MAG: hypothetical protein A2X25_00870 [Chloroflexi bacterium GWB2_49_20]|nr:MAG: hypothetical protein A2X25_00870 [Chloroflexi bacterium GWB2_49_20]OGN77536.1 MAG: hypothetical protein A2X26_02230 [Chloroflexi bacterium GWC2_49_37]OGN83201.1 MAG: hypothetical protein A2X27_13490 [Chloroflexi bacterium GWD2_49_16]